jgi:xylulokinase
MSAALGVGLRSGEVLVSIGTSGTVMTVSDRPTADPSGAVAGFADATGRWLPLVCTLNATRVTDAVARWVGAAGHEAFDALALSATAGAGGVVCVPWFDGERTPNRPGATGSFHGLRPDTAPAQLARAAVEGVVCGLLGGLDALGAAVPEWDGIPRRLILVGGGARSAAYRQVLADLAGCPVSVVDPRVEPVALGACVQAAAALTGAPPEDVAAAWSLGVAQTVVDPTPGVDAVGIREAWGAAWH